jgi:hypothetical protein
MAISPFLVTKVMQMAVHSCSQSTENNMPIRQHAPNFPCPKWMNGSAHFVCFGGESEVLVELEGEGSGKKFGKCLTVCEEVKICTK